jgi:N-acetylmuramoyl-L-alanine amidase
MCRSRQAVRTLNHTQFPGVRILALLLALLVPAVRLARAGDWQIVRHDGRDYVTLDSLAAFYDLKIVPPAPTAIPTPPDAPKQVFLDNGRHQVVFTLNSRLALIDGVNQWLGFPIATEGQKVLISRLDLVKTVEPSLRPELITGLNPVDTVVLDPGHGGHDKGAVCVFGNEKDFALDVCQRARLLLQASGLKVLMTRADDTFIPLEQRPVVANATPNSIFVAVHFNDATSNASGFEIYSITPRGEPSTSDNDLSLRDLSEEPGNVTDVPSLALSESIYHSLLGNIPQVDRGVKHARFAVIRLATVPAVLIEGGFVSSTTEARQIATPAYRQELAEAIVTGIESFKTLAEHHVPPKLLSDYRHQPPASLQMAPIVQTNAAAPLPAAPASPKIAAPSTPTSPSATQ